MVDKFNIYPVIEGGGRAAIAVEFDRDSGLVEYGVAWCSPKDQFVKKKGRGMAEMRLEVGRIPSRSGKPRSGYGAFYADKTVSRYNLVAQVVADCQEYLNELQAPQWVERFEFNV